MVITYLKKHRKKIYVICFFSVLALCAHIYNTHYYSYQLEKEIMKGDVESVREIAAKKAMNINGRPYNVLVSTLTESDNNTPLEVALREGEPEIARILLDNGADISKCNNIYWVNILLSKKNQAKLLELMINEEGCDIHEKSGGDSMFYWISNYLDTDKNNQEEMFQYITLLLDGNREITIKDKAELFVGACSCGNIDIVRYMLQNNYYNDKMISLTKETPLTAAVQNGQPEVYVYLIDYGEDPYIRNQYGKNAIDIIKEICKDIESKGDDANKVYSKKQIKDYFTLLEYMTNVSIDKSDWL